MLFHIVLLIFFVLPACLVAGYYMSLAAARLCGATAWCAPSNACKHSFVVLIPAHNEEAVIRRSIESCLRLDYPRDKYTVVVVADNCTDATAEVARRHGVPCLERTDPERHGKGHALEWAFRRLPGASHDAVLVIDSDCTVDRHALRSLDTCLSEGSQVVQLNHIVTNPDAGALCYAARVGQFLEYDFGYEPKAALGLWVPLGGTGMVFHRAALEQHPWTADSVVEDMEYSLHLARLGVAVRFVANAAVRHEAEAGLQQLAVQRRRWARGTLRLGKRQAVSLFLSGLFRGRLLLADAGWTLLTMSRPLVLVHLALSLVLSAGLAAAFQDPFAWGLLATALGAVAAQAAYYTTGILGVGLTGPRLRLLASAPMVTLRLAWIAVRSLFDFAAPTWDRTPRTAEVLVVVENVETGP